MKLLPIIMAVLIAVSFASASTYTREYSQIGNKIVIEESIDGIEKESFVSDQMLEKGAKGYYFIEKMSFNESYDSVEVRLNLDSGFIIEKDNVFPANYETETDGQIITLVWTLGKVEKGKVFAVFASILDTDKDYAALGIISFVILLLVAAYLIYKKQSKGIKSDAKPGKYEHLLDTEKKVIELLKSADRHELWQRQIQDSTGFSKAKVSRLIRNLESRGLITKIPFGNTNKVRLK